MTILRVGATKKYADNWASAFGEKKKATKKKATTAKKKTTKKKAKKKK